MISKDWILTDDRSSHQSCSIKIGVLKKFAILTGKHVRVSFNKVASLKANHSKQVLWWWWIVFVIWLTDERRLAFIPAGTIVRDPHHLESRTCHEQDLNLRRTWSWGFVEWSCAVSLSEESKGDWQFFVKRISVHSEFLVKSVTY